MDVDLVSSYLDEANISCELIHVDNEKDFISALENNDLDLVLSDFLLPDFDGLSALKISKEKVPDIPVVIISGELGEETAIEMLKSGATDYVLKQRMERLIPSITRAIQEAEERLKRKKAEKNLIIALEKATESDRLKTVFLNTMSHELRTPLNAVIGFSQIIDEETPMQDVLNMAGTIHKSGEHLLKIIEDIFNISLIESGNVKAEKESFSLSHCISHIHDQILMEQQNSGKQHLELRFCPPPGSKEITLFSDQAKLKEILLKLLRNALKFTREGFVEFGFTREGKEDKDFLKFYISDTGIGIHRDLQQIIFDPFRQAEETHTRGYGGSGLGLAISKKFVNILGGEIWVESELGKGSTFYFTIPVTQPETISKPVVHVADSIPEMKFSGKKILIVEDEDSCVMFLDVILSMQEAETIRAINGEEAVKLCQSDPEIDLVLMDLKLPVMDGYKATALIKQQRPDLPVIAQTAYAIYGDEEKALKTGCDDYISKPIDKDELIRKIQKYLSL